MCSLKWRLRLFQFQQGFYQRACAGQSVGLIAEEEPVADIVASTVAQFFEVMAGLAARFGSGSF